MPDPHPPWRRQPLGSLATRIIALVFVATFVTAFLVSAISVHTTYTFMRRPLEQAYPALLADRASHLESWLESHRSRLRESVAHLGPAVASQEGLSHLLARDPAFGSAAVLDAAGQLVTDSTGDPEPLELQARTAEGNAPGYAIVLRANGDALPAAVLRLEEGRTLVATVAPQALAEHLRPTRPTSGVAFHLAPRPLAGARPGALPEDRLATSRSESGGFVVEASHALHLLPADLVLEQPFSEAFEPVFAVVTRVFVVDLGILLLFSLLAYRITSAIVRPIEQLSEGARRISKGELHHEIAGGEGNDELGLLTRTFNDMTQELRRQRGEVEEANAKLLRQNEELQRANEVLEQLSITDGLTKLHNHRYFQDYLTREIKRVSRTGDPLSILLIDIDDFKRLNDRQGHAAGDELLVRLASILNDASRETDLVVRYGGEEFVMLAPHTDLGGAVLLAEKVRTAVAETSFILSDTKQLTRMTVSIGVASYQGSRKAFFRSADQALYRAKDAGKNCVVAFEAEDASPPDA
jgi:diguanylate cyclase (GGDEF)-like protein